MTTKPDDTDDVFEEGTDDQIAEAERDFHNILKKVQTEDHGITISRETYLLLKKMEDYAQDLAELVVRYFKEKDLDVRKDLILKSVEVLKLNPPPGPGIVAIKDSTWIFEPEEAVIDTDGAVLYPTCRCCSLKQVPELFSDVFCRPKGVLVWVCSSGCTRTKSHAHRTRHCGVTPHDTKRFRSGPFSIIFHNGTVAPIPIC